MAPTPPVSLHRGYPGSRRQTVLSGGRPNLRWQRSRVERVLPAGALGRLIHGAFPGRLPTFSGGLSGRWAFLIPPRGRGPPDFSGPPGSPVAGRGASRAPARSRACARFASRYAIIGRRLKKYATGALGPLRFAGRPVKLRREAGTGCCRALWRRSAGWRGAPRGRRGAGLATFPLEGRRLVMAAEGVDLGDARGLLYGDWVDGVHGKPGRGECLLDFRA